MKIETKAKHWYEVQGVVMEIKSDYMILEAITGTVKLLFVRVPKTLQDCLYKTIVAKGLLTLEDNKQVLLTRSVDVLSRMGG